MFKIFYLLKETVLNLLSGAPKQQFLFAFLILYNRNIDPIVVLNLFLHKRIYFLSVILNYPPLKTILILMVIFF